MGSTSCSLSLMAILFLLVPHSLGDTQGLINQVCRQTSDFNFCRDVFNKHLPGPNTDIKGLTQVALAQTLIASTNTIISIRRAESATSDAQLKNLLKICDSGYNILSDQFQEASFAFARGDYKRVSFLAGKCDRLITDCQSALGNRVPQITVQNNHNRVLVKMSLVSDQLIG